MTRLKDSKEEFLHIKCAVGFDAENNDAKNGTTETEVYVRGRHRGAKSKL